MNKENTKDDTYFKICNAVTKLEVSKGHLAWRLSDIAKEANVTRSLIYYYFGKEKEVILEEAFRFMLDLFFNLDRKDSVGVKERIKHVSAQIRSMPWIFILFYLQKDTDSEIGRLIRAAESKLLDIFESDFPDKTREELLKLYVLELGCVTFKTLAPEQIDHFFSDISE